MGVDRELPLTSNKIDAGARKAVRLIPPSILSFPLYSEACVPKENTLGAERRRFRKTCVLEQGHFNRSTQKP